MDVSSDKTLDQLIKDKGIGTTLRRGRQGGRGRSGGRRGSRGGGGGVAPQHALGAINTPRPISATTTQNTRRGFRPIGSRQVLFRSAAGGGGGPSIAGTITRGMPRLNHLHRRLRQVLSQRHGGAGVTTGTQNIGHPRTQPPQSGGGALLRPAPRSAGMQSTQATHGRNTPRVNTPQGAPSQGRSMPTQTASAMYTAQEVEQLLQLQHVEDQSGAKALLGFGASVPNQVRQQRRNVDQREQTLQVSRARRRM